jgi:MFS family permease
MNTASPQSIAYERRWWVLAVLAISVFMVVVDNLIVNVALPTLQSELNATTTSLQWIVDSYALVFAGLLLAGGGIGDRYGRKRTLQVGLVLFAACSGMAAFASTTNSLIFWRGAMGIGAALVFPATLAIITNLFIDPIERAKAIGLWSAVSGMAVAFGPVVGGFMLEHFWWGSVFLINLPIVAISLIAGARLIPDSRNPDAHALDKVGFLLSVIAIGSLVFTVIESPHWGWGSQKSNLGFGIGVLTLIGFVLFESKKEAPLLEVTFFKSARFSAATGSIGIFLSLWFHIPGYAVFPIRSRVRHIECRRTHNSICRWSRCHCAIGCTCCTEIRNETDCCFGTFQYVAWFAHRISHGCRQFVLGPRHHWNGSHGKRTFICHFTVNRRSDGFFATRKSWCWIRSERHQSRSGWNFGSGSCGFCFCQFVYATTRAQFRKDSRTY